MTSTWYLKNLKKLFFLRVSHMYLYFCGYCSSLVQALHSSSLELSFNGRSFSSLSPHPSPASLRLPELYLQGYVFCFSAASIFKHLTEDEGCKERERRNDRETRWLMGKEDKKMRPTNGTAQFGGLPGGEDKQMIGRGWLTGTAPGLSLHGDQSLDE